MRGRYQTDKTDYGKNGYYSRKDGYYSRKEYALRERDTGT